MPPTVVVDASAMVELLRRTSAGGRAEIVMSGAALAAPAHLDAEVLSALARISRDAPREESHVGARLTMLAQAPITRYPCVPLVHAAWDLRANVAARDALYVALARELRATLLTADGRLSRAPRNVTGVPVHVI